LRRFVGRLQTKLILTYLFIIGVILGVVGIFVARPFVAYAAVVTFGIAIVLSLWMVRRLSCSVTTMVDVAHQIAEGDLSRRVAVPEEQELAMLARALNTLGQKLQERLNNVEEEQARTAGILESMVEGLVAIDQQGRIVLMNGAALRMLRMGQDLEGTRHLLEIIRHPELHTLLQECDTCAAGTVCRRELTLHSPPMTLMVHAVPLRRGADRGGTLLVFHDVTELRRLERVRQEFVANASHELRTPLAHVKGYVELLEGKELGQLTPEQGKAVSVISRATLRLEHLIEDLIAFSTASREGLALDLRPAQLAQLAEATLERSKDKAALAGVAIQLSVDRGLPYVQADMDKLSWVLYQLVDNAIKFTLSGGRVKLWAEQVDRYVTVAVSDTGIGIPSDKFEEIFEPFHQLDGSPTRRRGGTGLGLALVKQIVSAHGASIQVESTENAGSTFRFDLPLATDSA